MTRLLSRFDRAALAGFIAVAIDLLDVADGDTDLGDGDDDRCSAGDDAPIAHWGDGGAGDPEDAEDGHDAEQVNEDGSDDWNAPVPRYGVDQSAGPINGRDAERERYAAELGLVRSPTGGWRKPH